MTAVPKEIEEALKEYARRVEIEVAAHTREVVLGRPGPIALGPLLGDVEKAGHSLRAAISAALEEALERSWSLAVHEAEGRAETAERRAAEMEGALKYIATETYTATHLLEDGAELEEQARTWARVALDYRNRARAALASPAEPGREPHHG